ncbi:DUF2332 domain-containing protein [Dermacoccaceae bacterium W4C1]
MDGIDADISAAYRQFAQAQAAGYCPPYEEIATAIAGDSDTLQWLATLPQAKQQPNLLLGAVSYLGGPVQSWAAFGPWLAQHRDAVQQQMLARGTQTNEAGRCACLLPWIPTDRPVALIEVGMSAGLCLFPDQYGYRYRTPGGDVSLGSGTPVLECQVGEGVTLPTGLPQVHSRAGVDLNPLDAADPDTARWLAALIWPGQQARRDRLRAAAATVAARAAAGDTVRAVTGDLVEQVSGLVEQVPAEVTPVVFHSAVLAYVPQQEQRRAFEDLMAGAIEHRGAVWISNESPVVLPGVQERLGLDADAARAAAQGRFLLSVNGIPTAWTGPHGQSLQSL